MARESAIQIHRLRALFKTNDQSSSSSRAALSGFPASGAASVSLRSGSAAAFFEPTGDGVARDAEGARESAQRAALVIGAQDCFALFRGVAIRLRVVAACATAVGTEVALFAIIRQPVADDVDAAAVATSKFDCNHQRESTISPLIEPLPKEVIKRVTLDVRVLETLPDGINDL